ncbi:MAG: 2-C-methyl-D-erythritol 2,4-cyclodiphosphate synthase [Desulfosalsimonadaceae bacterium]|nr:2-C-methyl-D-erythritol 2,4-cyclodiphosphate synthase [Desulfosalsimonadaceae bacterium]
MRIGQGFDVHRFVSGRPLVLGGVEIAHEKGLEGHSDADVLLHAVCDALLGAANMGDIGMHFPDTDPAYKNIDSMELLKQTWDMVRVKYPVIINIDATLLAEVPKIAPYSAAMREKIASALEISPDAVNIKATTLEGLCFVGRNEGIAAMCVVLID